MLSEFQCRAAADALASAERRARQIPPLTESWRAFGAADAYAIQQINVSRRLADGVSVQGYKIGLTSSAIQSQLGVAEPDYGHLMSDMFLPVGGTVAMAALCQPRVEPELAFVLDRDLGGAPVTVGDVLGATALILPALEVIDSRIDQWRITLADTIADNASSARVVLGGAGVQPSALDLREVGVVLRKDGQPVAKGTSADVMGNPAAAVCWLVNRLASFGVRMAAGSVVLSGSCTRAIPAGPGDHFEADLSGIGQVSVSFS
jgi:2-keto-4-pentenoate hydratase